MANQRNWMSTLAFKRFRSKHYELSKIYWTHQLGIDCIKNQLQYARPEKFITEILPASFKKGKFPMKHDEMLKWTDDYLARARLHLLVVCAANLESYLKSATNLFILGKGYSKYVKTKEGERLKINKVGEAIGAPILKRDSLP
ncbi:MAG: hypothetical protein WAU96_15745, partial [Anaerolineae bacterium]